jgi:hypothetical protein
MNFKISRVCKITFGKYVHSNLKYTHISLINRKSKLSITEPADQSKKMCQLKPTRNVLFRTSLSAINTPRK